MRRGTLLALLCLILPAPLVCRAAEPPANPNVLLITLDTTRADKIDCIGGGEGLTPSLDMLAKRSFVFTRCESAVPLTLPSHVTIMSGWNPNRHGVRKNLETTVSPKVPLLAREFQKRGYRTGAFISASVLLGKYGLDRGFDTYNQSFYDPRNPEISTRRGDRTLNPALEWIKAQGGHPWFCWVHLYDPHYPYEPPMPFAAKYKKNPYDGEIAFMDAALGGFFQGLHRAGMLSSALVVVCGDHGEALGQHGEESHGVFIYDATTHVPLIIHLPGEHAGKKLADSVGLVDVAPTVRDLAGLKAVTGDGESLSPLMKGGKWTPRPIYMESLDGLYNYGWAPLYGLVKWPWKYILAPKPELYNLEGDPGETRNLVKKDPVEADGLKKTLQADITGVKAEHGKKIRLSREELKSLQSLGYIAGSLGKASGGYRDPKDMVPVLKTFNEAALHFQNGEYAQAEPLLEKVLAKDPNNPNACFYMGSILSKRNPGKAEAYLIRGLKAQKDFPQAYARLMELWIRQGKPERAFELGRTGIKNISSPDAAAPVRVMAAWALYKKGAPVKDVLHWLDSAVQNGQELASACKLRAVIALKSGHRKAALAYLKKMAGVAPPSQVADLVKEKDFKPLADSTEFWNLVLTARSEMQQEDGQ